MAPSTREVRKELIEQLTEKAVQITNIPKQAFTVVINELSEDALGCGGITVEEMKKAAS